MKTLIIAEKPSVGRDIAKALNCRANKKSFIEGNNYIVTWALGHLVTLADPDAYNPKYKNWDLDTLPIMPDKMKLIVINQTRGQFKTVQQQLSRKDVSSVVIATDAGREGELVARWILEKCNNRKPIKRLWISSVTDKAIKQGFASLKDGNQYINLYNSAQARAEADWLVGINATRALTTKFNAQLSCGRVQTPTLAMIAEKENEIRNFIPKDYYRLSFVGKGVTFTWQHGKSGQTRIFDKAKVNEISKNIENITAEIIDINKSRKKTFAPSLYDLTTLQRDANRIFGYSAKETLSIMQKLYEYHKVLTYPRTDSKYISNDIVETITDRLKAVRTGPYRDSTSKLLRSKIKANGSFVNDSKVSDHHAIIPTEQPVNLRDLSDSERKIFDLVVKRFLAVLYPPFEYEQTTIKAVIDKEQFTAKGKTVIAQGFKEVYEGEVDEESDEPEEQNLPSFKKGDKLTVSNIRIADGKTKPPARFTEGTLIMAMENPTKYMDSANKNLSKTLIETGGIGTVATRADIIEKLFSSFLIEKRGEQIYSTSKGRQLLELVPQDLRSPDLTGEWEQKLNLIARGNISKDSFISEIRTYTSKIIKEIKESDAQYRHDNLTGQRCPECDKFLLDVKGKKSSMLVCQDRQCGYRKTVYIVSNARCPKCHKKMKLYGETDADKTFICDCGRKEKLSSFKSRREKEGGGINKKEVRNIMNKLEQQQSKPEKNDFFDALNKLNFDKK